MSNLLKFILPLFFLQTSVEAQTSIRHLEPANWWTGMKNPELQLLVHGDGIAAYSPSINYRGVTIQQVHKVENPNYLFIDLLIAPGTAAGEVAILFENARKQKITHPFPLLARRKSGAEFKGFDASDVVYMITPDRFADGNPGNNDVAGFADKADRNGISTRHGGDIEGIIEQLDYLQNLGITALWANPMLENNQPQHSYHGYAITNFYKQDARFGTNEDYARLSQAAKQRGIKLVMDMVVNHCGSEHWWMKDLPTGDWLNFQGNIAYTTHKRESLHDLYASEYDKKLQSDGWFAPTMPDLNQRNPFFAKYLIQNTLWWIEYADLGGIRMDTYCYPDKDFMSRWSERVMTEYPNFNVVGEEWSLNPAIVANWQKGKITQGDHPSHLRSVMDFPLNNALIEALNTDEKTWNQGLTKVYQMLANDFQYAQPNDLMVFADNHDMSRFFSQVHEDFHKFRLGMAFLLTVRGIPQVYYGTEILMTNPKSDAHDEIRGEMPGGFGGTKNVFSGENLTERETEAKEFIQTILQWRKNTPAIHFGKTKHFAPENGVYVMFRYTDRQKVMVVLNKNDAPFGLDLTKFKEIIPSSFTAKDILQHKTITVEGTLQLSPNAPLILEIL